MVRAWDALSKCEETGTAASKVYCWFGCMAYSTCDLESQQLDASMENHMQNHIAYYCLQAVFIAAVPAHKGHSCAAAEPGQLIQLHSWHQM
jgi:hypothetical protein